MTECEEESEEESPPASEHMTECEEESEEESPPASEHMTESDLKSEASSPQAAEHMTESDLESGRVVPRRRVPKNSKLAHGSSDEESIDFDLFGSDDSDGNDTFHVFIKTMHGSTNVMMVKSTDTIDNVKSRIQVGEGIAPELYRLCYAGKLLENKFSLAYYGIKKEAMIFMQPCLPGGAGKRKAEIPTAMASNETNSLTVKQLIHFFDVTWDLNKMIDMLSAPDVTYTQIKTLIDNMENKAVTPWQCAHGIYESFGVVGKAKEHNQNTCVFRGVFVFQKFYVLEI
jgi:hypothetical protein